MKYSKELIEEIKFVIEKEELRCSVYEFENVINWGFISYNYPHFKEIVGEFKSFITKFNKRGMCHGKCCTRTDNIQIDRVFYMNNRQYGEQIKY